MEEDRFREVGMGVECFFFSFDKIFLVVSVPEEQRAKRFNSDPLVKGKSGWDSKPKSQDRRFSRGHEEGSRPYRGLDLGCKDRVKRKKDKRKYPFQSCSFPVPES